MDGGAGQLGYGTVVVVGSGFYKGLVATVLSVDGDDVMVRLREPSMVVYIERASCRAL